MKKACNNLVKGIKEYFKKNNFKRAVIGLSGGIDSSLAAYLAAKAIGKNNLHGIFMPEKGLTSRQSKQNALKIISSLKIEYSIIPINRFIASYRKNIKWKQSKTADINTKARIRANLLYNYANTHNALVIGTSNKSELMLGYFTKYGDGACDLEVIGDLYKTEVYKLAKHLNLPKEIIEREPTAELFHGHTDEKELGAKYEAIDKILKNLKKAKGSLADKIRRRVKENRHKR